MYSKHIFKVSIQYTYITLRHQVPGDRQHQALILKYTQVGPALFGWSINLLTLTLTLNKTMYLPPSGILERYFCDATRVSSIKSISQPCHTGIPSYTCLSRQPQSFGIGFSVFCALLPIPIWMAKQWQNTATPLQRHILCLYVMFRDKASVDGCAN